MAQVTVELDHMLRECCARQLQPQHPPATLQLPVSGLEAEAEAGPVLAGQGIDGAAEIVPAVSQEHATASTGPPPPDGVHWSVTRSAKPAAGWRWLGQQAEWAGEITAAVGTLVIGSRTVVVASPFLQPKGSAAGCAQQEHICVLTLLPMAAAHSGSAPLCSAAAITRTSSAPALGASQQGGAAAGRAPDVCAPGGEYSDRKGKALSARSAGSVHSSLQVAELQQAAESVPGDRGIGQPPNAAGAECCVCICEQPKRYQTVCGHVICCAGCTSKLMASGGPCLLCGRGIGKMVQIA